jgi:RNA polymerase sigma factor (sigma-70 family)
MFTHVHNLTEARAAKAYLRLMAIRRSLREKKKRSTENFIGDIEELISPDHAPDKEAEQNILLSVLEKCLRILSPKAMAVIRLKYTAQLTNEKIGQTVGGSKQYIGRLISNSLKLLKKCVQKGAVDNE